MRGSLSLLPFLFILAGCSGGGDTGSGVFQASLLQLTDDFSQFASGSQTYSGTARFVQSDGSSGSSADIDIAVRSANDGSGDIIVNIMGGADVRLSRDATSGQYLYTDTTGGLFAQAALGRDSGAILLVGEGGGLATAGFVVVGQPSGDVGVQSGKALYLGPSAFLAVSDNGAVNGGGGGFILEADFDTATVDGSIALTDTPTSTQFLIGFQDAPIAGNGFSTSTLTQSGLNGTVTASGLDATFYGTGAAEVGGTYTMDLVSGTTSTALAGAFVGGRQAGDLESVVASGGAVNVGGGESIVLGSGSVIGGSGSVYPDGSSSYYNSNTGVSFGADSGGCYYVGDWSNC